MENYYELTFKHTCPSCNEEMGGENITIRSWDEDGCSHNGTDHYLCPKCGETSLQQGLGPPYWYGQTKKE